ncbi:hypothetical protein CYR83_02905 [Ligilactobacillus agilis]|uniref:Uncharacterized protein n=1 Tax=Ligilactobacillus agilis TaxID=1601 RepID=A0A2I2AB42_9LACO|nr:hypothetical protein [Ligilactobacillus agilis]PLA76578.1 hypothetical protein CYR79_05595 [Ligilactobacillus agilis]PLA83546.1 hypothetical protein CYR83_02905 [Ligilactobacillus agilis]
MVRNFKYLGIILIVISVLALLGHEIKVYHQAKVDYVIYQKNYADLKKHYKKIKKKKRKVVIVKDKTDEVIKAANEVLALEKNFTEMRQKYGYINMKKQPEYKDIQLGLGRYLSKTGTFNPQSSPWNYDPTWEGKVYVGGFNQNRYPVTFVYTKDDKVMMLVSAQYLIKKNKFSQYQMYNTNEGQQATFYGDTQSEK